MGTGTVTFTVTFTLMQGSTVIGSPVTSGTVTSGAANASLTLPAGTIAGSYTIQVVYNAGAGFATSSDSSHTLTVGFTAPVPAGGNSCNGAYNGTFNGNLNVSSGQACVFVGGGVTGNITQTGGDLILIGSTVTGNVQIQGGGTFSLSASTSIQGNLEIQHLPNSTAPNQICSVNVKGNLQYQNSGAPVEIGAVSGCPGNAVGGDLQVQSITAAVAIFNNTVTGNLQVQNDTASTMVFYNTVSKSIQCGGNTTITGGGNTAQSKQQQCAGF